MTDDFSALGVRIVGASFDSPEANSAFRDKYSFEFELWSDLERTLAIFAGAAKEPSNRNARRVTIVLDAEGALVLRYDSVANVLGHPQAVLDDCRGLFNS